MAGRSLVRGVVIALVVTTCAVLGVSDQPPSVAATGPRIMVMGDSISQGFEGDYTWRYRASKRLPGFDFVGPHSGTHQVPASLPATWPDTPAPISFSGRYRPGIEFDSNHASQWGWQMEQAQYQVHPWVDTYDPTHLVVALGFNDLAWGVQTPDQLLDDVRTVVSEARKGNPSVKVLFTNVIQRRPLAGFPGIGPAISEYNAKLPAVINSLTTADSPVALADIASAVSYATDTYDGLHPNVRGEFKIAKAVVDRLKTAFGAGSGFGGLPATYPAALSMPARATRATRSGWGLKVSWGRTFGATGYRILRRDVTKKGKFKALPLPVPALSWTDRNLAAGHKFAYKVQPVRGDHRGKPGDFGVATAKPMPKVPNVRVSANPNKPYQVTVRWDPVPGAQDYFVYQFPKCDYLPPAGKSYTLVQWNLAGKNSWTQSRVTADCLEYRVVAARYGGHGKIPWDGPRVMPYQRNQYHAAAEKQFLTNAAAKKDRVARTKVDAGRDRGIVIARGYIANVKGCVGAGEPRWLACDVIGDRRTFRPEPWASSKITAAWDTATGRIGIYAHQSCIAWNNVGCKTAFPIKFVDNAWSYNDKNKSGYNYVSVHPAGKDALEVRFAALNSWSKLAPFGRINGSVRLVPSGGTYRARLQADRFPSWEIMRYPKYTKLGHHFPTARVIGTRGQTSLHGLSSGGLLTCNSSAPDTVNKPNQMC